MRGRVGRELLLLRKSGPFVDKNFGAAGLGDFARGIGRFRIDDDNLVRPRNRFTSGVNVFFLVEGDDAGGDLHLECADFPLPSGVTYLAHLLTHYSLRSARRAVRE